MLQAVVQVPMFSEGPAPWPVAAVAPGSWLVLSAGCTAEQAGLFVASLATRIDVASPGGRDEVVDALLAEELLIVAGGLQLSDTSAGTVIVPGCCCGLEDWREWTRVLIDGSPWLGHDPGPEIEVIGEDVRVWQDGGPNRERGRWAEQRVDLPCRAFPQLLLGVQRDLFGFLNALAGWAKQTGLGPRGAALVERVDQHFAITAPLELPAD
ncbi:hypothetical protein ACN27F_03730 [Solwaraspora sp. WMMB335]|uniref:hypothetical protein n=1 Tax=Solwaraspora sp. WMMB335 TaxID=3404118 RepID=UPI003B94FD1D